jgi:hypothetical protein
MSKNISGTEETKVVQTELPSSRYELFKLAARERGMTIKEAAREALIEFTLRYQPVDQDDPLFAPLEWDVGDDEPIDDASERIDDIAYGDLEAEDG